MSNEMKGSSSGSEDREEDRKHSQTGNLKLSVSDLGSEDFKKAWLTLKAVHDRELHRLQVKLSNMRKARLTEGRRFGGLVPMGTKALTQASTQTLSQALSQASTQTQAPTQAPEASSSNVCERCLVNETYKKVLEQEFSNMQQKNLVQIAELTVENNKLKEENRMLLERLNPTPPRVRLSFSDSDYEDFVASTQMEIKHMYTVKEPPQGVEILPYPRHITKPHEQKKILSMMKVEAPPPPDKQTPQNSQEIQVVSETSFVDSPCIEENGTKETNILLSCTRCSIKASLDSSQKDKSDNLSKPPEVKKTTSTEKCGKNTLTCSFSSISSEESAIVSETSEENMPCNPSFAWAFLEKKRWQSSTQAFPVDYTSKYIQKRRSTQSGSTDIAVTSAHAPLLSRGETTLKSTCESENRRHFAKRSRSDSERFFSEIWLKSKSK